MEEKKEKTTRKPRMTLQAARKRLLEANELVSMRGSTDEEIIAKAREIGDEKMYSIEIQEKDDASGPASIIVCGNRELIPRGKKVVVKSRIVEALKNAIGFKYVSTKDAEGHMFLSAKRNQAELFVVHGEAK